MYNSKQVLLYGNISIIGQYLILLVNNLCWKDFIEP